MEFSLLIGQAYFDISSSKSLYCYLMPVINYERKELIQWLLFSPRNYSKVKQGNLDY